jgi:predicted dehydrogenase
MCAVEEARLPTDRIAVAVVGAGLAGRTHAFAYRNVAALFPPANLTIDLVAVADVDPRLAEEVALQFGFKRSYQDWGSVASDADVDAVSVAVPNFMHEEVVSALLRAGKHVLCEKPLASTAAASLRLTRIASDASLVAAVGFNFRCVPGVRAIRDRLAAGLMGAPQQFVGRYLTDYAKDSELPHSWRFDHALAGGGASADVGAHLIDVARFMFGDVEAVSGALSRIVIGQRPVAAPSGHDGQTKPVTNDDFAIFSLEFAGGAVGQMALSRVSTGFRNSLAFTVVGDQATAEFDSERLAEFGYAEGSTDEQIGGFTRVVTGPAHPYLRAGLSMSEAGAGYGVAETFVFETRDFLAAILDRRSAAAASFTDGYEVALVLEAFERSVNERGGRVAISDVRDDVERATRQEVGDRAGAASIAPSTSPGDAITRAIGPSMSTNSRE